MFRIYNWLRALWLAPVVAGDPAACLSPRDWADLPPYHPHERN